MGRLTERLEGVSGAVPTEFNIFDISDSVNYIEVQERVQDVLDKLCAYEDIGEPDELAALKAENELIGYWEALCGEKDKRIAELKTSKAVLENALSEMAESLREELDALGFYPCGRYPDIFNTDDCICNCAQHLCDVYKAQVEAELAKEKGE